MGRKRKTGTELGYALIGKAKLPKGASFPIERSALDEFLRREALTSVNGVAFCGASPNGAVLSADYYGPRHRHARHTLNLWIYAVPAAIHSSVAALVMSTALPQLAAWIRSFNDASLLRAQTDHSIRFLLEQVRALDQAAAPAESGIGGLRLVQSTARWQ